MEIQDVMKQIDEAALTQEQALALVNFLIGYLGDDKQEYDTNKIVKAFESGLNNTIRFED